jgi:glycosyltransferase involved in cell wall biosynthesis
LSEHKLRLAIIPDYREEDWPSMDLCADMLTKYLQEEHNTVFDVQSICPPFSWRLKRIPKLGEKGFAYNSDRLLNRFWDYPQYLKKKVNEFDLFHVSDHTYAQLVHVLPPERTGVFCHDIDAFRSLIEPTIEPRPAWYRAMSQRILTGLQKAAVVFYSTTPIKNQIEHYNLLDSSRLVHAPYGISSEFSLINQANQTTAQDILKQVGEMPFLLHVGSCIPRKRIDILLEVFAEVRKNHPELRLVKVSGDWTNDQLGQINQLGLEQSIVYLKGLTRSQIATLYRKATLVLLTSEAEGFGLPVIEALACGAIIVASDIPVLREVGGRAVNYCPVGDISTWVKTVDQLVINPNYSPELETRLAQSQKYSWSTHANTIAEAYLNLK